MIDQLIELLKKIFIISPPVVKILVLVVIIMMLHSQMIIDVMTGRKNIDQVEECQLEKGGSSKNGFKTPQYGIRLTEHYQKALFRYLQKKEGQSVKIIKRQGEPLFFVQENQELKNTENTGAKWQTLT